MLFPMLASLAIGSAPDRTDVASARLFIAGGGAVVVAPLTLGAIADSQGLRAAFLWVPALFIAVAVLSAIGSRSRPSSTD